MERIERCYNLKRAVAFLSAIPAGQLHRPFVGFGAAVAEEHLVQSAVLHQNLRQLKLRNGVELVRCLKQCARLFCDSVGDDRVGVSDIVYSPTRREVQVLFVFNVPYPSAFAARDDNRLAAHNEHVVFAFFIHPFCGHIIALR